MTMLVKQPKNSLYLVPYTSGMYYYLQILDFKKQEKSNVCKTGNARGSPQGAVLQRNIVQLGEYPKTKEIDV